MQAIPSLLKVSDIMTRDVHALREGDSLSEADLEMRLGHFRHVPVVRSGNFLVGMVSSFDILAGLAKNVDRFVSVDELMVSAVDTVRPDAPARVAATLLVEKKVGAIPVVDDIGRLVGIVSEREFVRIALSVL